MITPETIELLEFNKVKQYIIDFCHSNGARNYAMNISIINNKNDLLVELHKVAELLSALSETSFFPNIEFQDFFKETVLLGLVGSVLNEKQFLLLKQSVEISNTAIRYLKNKKQQLPYLSSLCLALEENKLFIDEIDKIIDFDETVKSSASPELLRIRKNLSDKRRESDVKFNRLVNEYKKLGYIRDNEESYFNGRRTLAVLVEYKSEINGFVHNKSESGRTIFIEPGTTISINNDIAELEIDERREINKILRELTATLNPYSDTLKKYQNLLTQLDFIKAKALFAKTINATFPKISDKPFIKITNGFHPLLFLHNRIINKTTIPLNIEFNENGRLIVISGPNAGGKSVILKTIGLLQVMLQSGLLLPVSENSEFTFFNKILIDIGDTQSIEHELSTYSSKLKNMISILQEINENTLVLMDEFGSGTDPELGGAIAEVMLEEIIASKTFGVITTHFSNVKLLASKLPGVINGSMLFDLDLLQPKYILSVGEPGSSYTFEVAEKVGFPIHLINRAKQKADKEKLNYNFLLADIQQQKSKLNEAIEKNEHQEFMRKISKEKYDVLFNNWLDKTERERERKIELARLADFGMRYLRLMNDWNKNENRKQVIKRFIDGITAETNKRKELAKQNKRDNFTQKKVARLKPLLKIGSKVKILNSTEIGIVNEIKDEKVNITFGILKMTVNIENLELVRD